MAVVRFTTHEKKPCNLICCKAGSNAGVKTRNISIHLVLQQCCKASCTFFVSRFTVASLYMNYKHDACSFAPLSLRAASVYSPQEKFLTVYTIKSKEPNQHLKKSNISGF